MILYAAVVASLAAVGTLSLAGLSSSSSSAATTDATISDCPALLVFPLFSSSAMILIALAYYAAGRACRMAMLVALRFVVVASDKTAAPKTRVELRERSSQVPTTDELENQSTTSTRTIEVNIHPVYDGGAPSDDSWDDDDEWDDERGDFSSSAAAAKTTTTAATTTATTTTTTRGTRFRERLRKFSERRVWSNVYGLGVGTFAMAYCMQLPSAHSNAVLCTTLWFIAVEVHAQRPIPAPRPLCVIPREKNAGVPPREHRARRRRCGQGASSSPGRGGIGIGSFE
jgi:hypothetical protein